MSTMDTTVPDHLSWSRIRAYLTCSLQYFFRYFAKETPEFTPGALAFGSAIHLALETALVQRIAGEEPILDHLVGVFDGSLDEAGVQAPIRWSEKETRESVVAQARAMIDVWLRSPRPGKVIGVEESFEVELAPWLPKLHGRVDVIEESDDGSLTIIDIKSARSAWGEEQILQGRDQLVLYKEGLKGIIEAIGKPVKLAWEIILKQKVPRVVRIEVPEPLPTAERAIKTATIVLEAIEKDIYAPSPGWQCSGCPYRAACAAW